MSEVARRCFTYAPQRRRISGKKKHYKNCHFSIIARPAQFWRALLIILLVFLELFTHNIFFHYNYLCAMSRVWAGTAPRISGYSISVSHVFYQRILTLNCMGVQIIFNGFSLHFFIATSFLHEASFTVIAPRGGAIPDMSPSSLLRAAHKWRISKPHLGASEGTVFESSGCTPDYILGWFTLIL